MTSPLQILIIRNQAAFGSALTPWIHYDLKRAARWYAEFRNMESAA